MVLYILGSVQWERHFVIFFWLLGFPCGLAGKESTCNMGDLGSVPRLGRSPGEGKGNPLQYSSLETSMGCVVHGVAKSQTQLNNFHFFFCDFWRWVTLNNYEGSEIINLVCYSFMDVSRRHENPGSGTKDIITHDTANSISWVLTYLCCFHFPLAPRVTWWAQLDAVDMVGLCHSWWTQGQHSEQVAKIVAHSTLASLLHLEREPLHWSQAVVTTTYWIACGTSILPVDKSCSLAHRARTCRTPLSPWWIVWSSSYTTFKWVKWIMSKLHSLHFNNLFQTIKVIP